MVKMLVFRDIDSIIVGYIEALSDFRNLLFVNKYCHKLVTDNKFFQEWQFLVSKDKINFLNACNFGCLNISKYLFIENNVENNKAFRLSCSNGHLEVCKFLIQLDKNIDIHAANEYAFISSKKNKHFEVYNFLIQLDKKNEKVVYS